jgi:hypothetical protein
MKTWKVSRKRITLSHNNTILTVYYGKDSKNYKGVYHYNYCADGLRIGHLVYDKDDNFHGCFNMKYGTVIWAYLKSSAIKLEHKRYPTYAFSPNIPKEILSIL